MITIKQFVLRWNNQWKYDYWWRQKYNVSFNSKLHRQVSQIDIVIEYFEHKLAEQTFQQQSDKQERLKHYKDTGQWMKIDRDKEEELFDNIDISQF